MAHQFTPSLKTVRDTWSRSSSAHEFDCALQSANHSYLAQRDAMCGEYVTRDVGRFDPILIPARRSRISRSRISSYPAIFALCFLFGCSQESSSRSIAPTAGKSALMKRPFMFREAKLPDGYPEPGPVGQVIIKTYPVSRIAMVQAGDAPAGEKEMFQLLFNHIKKEKISMTSPVVMGYNDEGDGRASMAFVSENPSIGQMGADGKVSVVDLPQMIVVSVGVRGSYNEAHFQAGLAQIHEWLSVRTKSLRVSGPPRYLGYNSPFVPWFLRYGEVQLPVEPL